MSLMHNSQAQRTLLSDSWQRKFIVFSLFVALDSTWFIIHMLLLVVVLHFLHVITGCYLASLTCYNCFFLSTFHVIIGCYLASFTCFAVCCLKSLTCFYSCWCHTFLKCYYWLLFSISRLLWLVVIYCLSLVITGCCLESFTCFYLLLSYVFHMLLLVVDWLLLVFV